MLLFRQLFDPASSTYSYLLADAGSRDAVLIDPVFEQARRDAALVRELGLHLRWTLDTHVHADHVTGAWLLRQWLGSGIALGADTGAAGADRLLADGDSIDVGNLRIGVRATPGHTNGCMTYVLAGDSGPSTAAGVAPMAFTGDCLLVRGSGRTDFQHGSAAAMYRSVHDRIFTLPGHCLLYPAHDYRGLTVSSVDEERRHNPRLGGAISESDFADTMAHLNLPHPKQLAVAVPANLQCGRPMAEAGTADDPRWAELRFTFGGIWEIEPRVLQELGASVQIVDVREAVEFDGPLGHISGAVLLPLQQLQQRAAELDGTRPVVAVCRSGARSAQATALLRKAGFTQVANLAGGMLRWRADGNPVNGAGGGKLDSNPQPASALNS